MTAPPNPPLLDPPAGELWDCSLERAPFAFVDLEMTGLEPAHDHIVEICIDLVVGGERRGGIETLVRPPARAGRNAHVHGLFAAKLESAPPFCEIADEVLRLCDPSSSIIVAHGASWDIAFLEAELARCGRPVRFPFYLDTLVLSRRALALPSHSLESLARFLGIQQLQPHRAGDDVRVLKRVFARLIEILAPASPRDLWHVRVGERHVRPDILAACILAAERQERVVLAYRPARRPPRPFEAVITGVRTDLDPPRVLGYALPGRGRFDLRVDRILSITATAQ